MEKEILNKEKISLELDLLNCYIDSLTRNTSVFVQ